MPGITEDGVGAAVDDAKIIRTGTIELEVKDVADGARHGAQRDPRDGRLRRRVADRERRRPAVATITYRIPADRWEDALDLLRGLNGQTTKVVTEQTEAVEVTGQVIDLEARIRNLRASETALQEIAAGAARISDVLEVQQPAHERPRADRAAQRAARRPRGSGRVRDADRDLQRAGRRGRGWPREGWEPGIVVDEATASLVDSCRR